MKDEFRPYLTSIGIGEPITERIEEIYSFYEEILRKFDDEIEDIFISDYIKNDGSRTYDSLWFFSNKFLMESKLFINNDEFDFYPIQKGFVWINIKKQNYDFKKAVEQSRLLIEYLAEGLIDGNLKASKENCDKLRDITNKYLIPLIM